MLKEDKSVFASANIGNNIVINSHRIFMIYFQVPVLIFCVSVLLKTDSDNLSFHMPFFFRPNLCDESVEHIYFHNPFLMFVGMYDSASVV